MGRQHVSEVQCPLCNSCTRNHNSIIADSPPTELPVSVSGTLVLNTHSFFPFLDDFPAPVCFHPPPFFPVPAEFNQRMQLPWTSVPYDFTNFSIPEDSQSAIEIANEHPSIRQAIAPRIISENGRQQSLQDYLQTHGL